MKYALITGASKGIGKSMAAELAKKGYGLLLVARSEQLLQNVAAELTEQYKIPTSYLAVDLVDITAPEVIFKWTNDAGYQIEILINNAGYGLNGLLEDYSLAEYLAMMQVNMNALVALTYLYLPQLKKLPKAYIGNIASSAAFQSVPGLNVYAASKAFVRSFSRGLAYELRKTGVKVTCVCPGTTDTQFAERANITNAKAVKMAAQFNMSPIAVAQQAVEGLLAGKVEVVPGFVNKATKYISNIVPDAMLEQSAASIYGI